VDAVIRLKEGLVPVDASFPWRTSGGCSGASDDDRRAARKEFARDIKNTSMTSTTATSCRRRDLPFALMYIPAENVYYETIIKAEEEGEKALYAYATSKQVMPVSPIRSTLILTLAQGSGDAHRRACAGIIDHLNRLRRSSRSLAKISTR